MTNIEKMAKILKDEGVTHFNMFLPSCPKDASEEYKAGEFLRMYKNMNSGKTIHGVEGFEFW